MTARPGRSDRIRRAFVWKAWKQWGPFVIGLLVGGALMALLVLLPKPPGSVRDVTGTLAGLGPLSYPDGATRAGFVSFEGENDRVYLSTRVDCRVGDRIDLKQRGASPRSALWVELANPRPCRRPLP
jgi:hypothetical protein